MRNKDPMHALALVAPGYSSPPRAAARSFWGVPFLKPRHPKHIVVAEKSEEWGGTG